MPDFSPDLVSFGDAAGYGMWDDGHAREHLAFARALAQQRPAVLLPVYDFQQFLTAGQGQRSLLESHFTVHTLLRNVTGVNGVDLTQVDLANPDDFQVWLGYHLTEHAQMRQALGMV